MRAWRRARDVRGARPRWTSPWWYSFRKRPSPVQLPPLGWVVQRRAFCHSEIGSEHETEGAAKARAGDPQGIVGTGQAFHFPGWPDEARQVLGLRRRGFRCGGRTAVLGLPPSEDQRLARERAADARS